MENSTRDEKVPELNNHSQVPLVNNVRRDTIISLQARRIQPPPDGGWGWLVCLASFYCNGIVFGILNTFGVMFVFLKEKFSETHKNSAFLTSWVGSVAIGMTFLMSPVSSILTDKLGIRRTVLLGGMISATGMLLSSFVELLELLYLTYGVIMGFGASLIYTPSLVILGHYFDKRMGLVNGIVAAGSSVFTAFMPKALKFSIENFGLSHTMQTLAILLALTMVSALVFRPLIQHTPCELPKNAVAQLNSPQKKSPIKNFLHKLFNVKIWKNRQYVIWVIAIPSALFGYFVPFIHLVQYVENILPTYDSTVAITCMGAASGIGRLFFGTLADLPCINRLYLQQLSFLMIGICTMLLVAAPSFPLIVTLSFIIGLFDGCFISLLGPIAFDIVGTKSASQAIGFCLGLCSIPLMIGPPVAGAIYDSMHTYRIAFLIAGVPPIIGAIMMFWIHRVRPKFPAMSMENIVEDAFTSDSAIKPDNQLPNGKAILLNNSLSNGEMKFSNIELGQLKNIDEDDVADAATCLASNPET